MPFQSDAQRRFMYSQKPEVAKEMAAKTPAGAKMPERVAMPQMPMAKKPMSASNASLTPERKKMAMQSMVSKYGKA